MCIEAISLVKCPFQCIIYSLGYGILCYKPTPFKGLHPPHLLVWLGDFKHKMPSYVLKMLHYAWIWVFKAEHFVQSFCKGLPLKY